MRPVIATAVLALLATGWDGAAQSDDFRWTVVIAPGKTIEIKGVNGAVRAELASGTQVEVVAHKRARRSDPSTVSVQAVEDNGSVEDPERVRRALAGDASLDSVGLGNVDSRLRNAYGDDFGLVVETAPGAGTKVTVRVPKFAPGVHV